MIHSAHDISQLAWGTSRVLGRLASSGQGQSQKHPIASACGGVVPQVRTNIFLLVKTVLILDAFACAAALLNEQPSPYTAWMGATGSKNVAVNLIAVF